MELNYNRVHLCGQAADVPTLSHVNHGCAFYRFTLSVLRLSGQADELPVIVPQAAAGMLPVTAGDRDGHRPAAFLQQQERAGQPSGDLRVRPPADPWRRSP